MKLGIIGGESEKDFQYVQSLGLGYIEFCINVGQNAFEHAARAEEIAGYSKKYGVAVSSIGRWGTERLLPPDLREHLISPSHSVQLQSTAGPNV